MNQFCYFKFLFFAICFGFQVFAVSAQNLQKLELNESFEREIKGGETHNFIINIGAKQTARVEIIQKGIDVSLAAFKPNGEVFIESESPSGLAGNDLILVTASESGEYKVAVSPADPRSAAGKYVVKLTEIRPSVAPDFEINEAAKKITKVAEETHVLRQKGTREGRRQALEKFQEVVRLAKIKQDKTWEIVALISSGVLYEQLGEPQKALDFYLQGLKLTRETGNRQYEGTALNNLAVNYNMIAEYETGISYLTQALNLHQEFGNKRDIANDYNNLGVVNFLLGDLLRAETFYTRSLVLRREIKDQRGEGFALDNLGQTFSQSGDAIKSTDFLRQALALRQAIGDKQGESITRRNLGKNFWKAGDLKNALENFEKSNSLASEVGDRRVEAESFYWLALIEKDRANFPKAVENIESGLKIIEQIRGEYVNPQLRASYFSTVQQFYELYVELLISRYEKSKDEKDAAQALEISERARTRSLIELLQEARINVRQGVDEKLLDQAAELQDTLNAKYRQKAQLSSGKNTPEQLAKITGEINSLAAEIENLQMKIRRENPRYADLTQGAALSAKEIQNLLDDETVLLEYKLGESRSFLWLVTKNTLKTFVLPPRKEIEKTAQEFYDTILSRDKTGRRGELSNLLGKILLAPAAAEIGNKRIAFVADGILQHIPLSALQMPDVLKKNATPLAATNEIVVLPSMGVLAELRRNSQKTETTGNRIAIFADAIFEANDTRLSSAAKINKSAEKSSDMKAVMRDFSFGENFPRLLSSRVEARNILAFLPKEQVAVNLDFDASRENTAGAKLIDYNILHFATHGLLNTSRPELSGLVFSLYDKNGTAQNGFLSLGQIYNLNLRSDLVVLSACQTALGKNVRGEGLIGLTRGFMYAGARRVVASLWKVDDAATAEFMKRFYQNLLQKNQIPSVALQSAQNEMKAIPRFRAPYFWAGFTMQGDWQ